MKVGLHAAKYKRPTWNSEVEKAVNENSLARLESFFSVWAVKMNQSKHPYGFAQVQGRTLIMSVSVSLTIDIDSHPS